MDSNKTQIHREANPRHNTQLPRILNVIIWLVFIAGSAWLILSDLNVVPRLAIVDRYYWLLLIIFILLTTGSLFKHPK